MAMIGKMSPETAKVIAEQIIQSRKIYGNASKSNHTDHALREAIVVLYGLLVDTVSKESYEKLQGQLRAANMRVAKLSKGKAKDAVDADDSDDAVAQ